LVVPKTVAIDELPLPAARVTVLPETGLLLTSKRVTVIVESVAPSSGTDVGLATTVDTLALTAPAVKVTVGVAVITREDSEVSVAVNTSAPAVVDLTVKVTTPAALEDPEAGVMFGNPGPDVLASVTVFAETALPNTSFKVTVIVEVAVLSATTVVGEATTVDVPAFTTAATTGVKAPVLGVKGVVN
jgi:hypothetical protein